MPASWPESLPLPRQQEYGVTGELPIVKTPMESGRSRAHRVSKTIMRSVSCSFVLNVAQSSSFWNFFETDANAGADWFYMNIITANRLAVHLVRISSYPQLREVRQGFYEISFTLDVDTQVVL